MLISAISFDNLIEVDGCNNFDIAPSLDYTTLPHSYSREQPKKPAPATHSYSRPMVHDFLKRLLAC
mgnify:CR=1 FL=1